MNCPHTDRPSIISLPSLPWPATHICRECWEERYGPVVPTWTHDYSGPSQSDSMPDGRNMRELQRQIDAQWDERGHDRPARRGGRQ